MTWRRPKIGATWVQPSSSFANTPQPAAAFSVVLITVFRLKIRLVPIGHLVERVGLVLVFLAGRRVGIAVDRGVELVLGAAQSVPCKRQLPLIAPASSDRMRIAVIGFATTPVAEAPLADA